MEAPQDAQAVLSPEPPRLVLELVQPLDELAGQSALGCLLLWGGGVLLAVYVNQLLEMVPAWALVGPGLLGYLLLRVFGAPRLLPAAAPRREVGRLLVYADQLVLQTGGLPRAYPLDARTRVVIRYQGYRHEQLAPRKRLSGIGNTIQLDGGPTYAFDLPHAARASTLREELRQWYLRRVQLKEYVQNSRTFLLNRNLSYEQIQAYKQEFGVLLYE